MEKATNTKKIIRKVIALSVTAIILSLIMLLRLLEFEIINHAFLILVIVLSFLVAGYSLLFKFIRHTKKQKYFYYQATDFLFVLNLALIFIQLFFVLVLFPATVEQKSMDPTLKDGDEVIVISLAKVSRGKVVIVKADARYNKLHGDIADGDLLVKRVIAGPGDSFYFKNGILYLNGKRVEEDYLPEGARTDDFSLDERVRNARCEPGKGCYIPEGYYFVMGDNRQNSFDSRDMGLIHKSQIMGVVKYRRKGFFGWEVVL